MLVECPYCSTEVDVVDLERHVRLMDGDGHGTHGTLPMDDVDNPWQLRLDVPDDPPRPDDRPPGAPTVEYVRDEVRRGRCPACDRGVMALKGGDGFLSRGRRRLACPNCGWESPEWIEIKD